VRECVSACMVTLYSLAQFPNNVIVVCLAGEVMVARVH
jgi:hypothetical protein